MFILGLTLLPLFGVFSQSSAVVRVGQHDIEALNFGSSLISQARKFLPKNVSITSGDKPLPASENGLIRLGPQGSENEIDVPTLDRTLFQCTYSISNYPFPPTKDGIPREARQLILRISWKESVGKDKNMLFTALLISDSVPEH
ncbi:MAG TPA: hypothetical protein PKM25_03710 [Candidatus Ozemobacteraceae bacterium]|nr:hypothetical protein [Candidatus Ozemobacteraceae bacterium]